ncbi:hypothetical protein EC968_004505 [Mortierella alpina]|nr:hypothetical protein EC968_004505 [Mortierella alpina]
MSCPAGYTFDTTARVAPYAAATETYEPGQRIKHWAGDIIWTKNHFPASRLEPLRRLGDPLADDALAALEIKPGDDALEALLAYTAQPLDEQKSPAPQRLLTQVMTVPDWVDWDRLERGQQVYWRYYPFMQSTLLHVVTASESSFPRPMKVFNSTGYLLGKRTKRRLDETSQFVHDMIHSPEYLRPGSGTAWKSMIQVRFLHAGVRARLVKISRGHPKYYNLEEYGVPINQEDLLHALFAVSALVWRVLELRLGVPMTTQEREDYLHLWRYVGYMMGVDDILGVTQTPGRADACVESLVLHLADPDAESGQQLLNWARSLHPPPKKVLGLLELYKIHMALVEKMIGSESWTIQKLPPTAWPYRVVRDLVNCIMFVDLWLVRNVSRWFHFRSSVIREHMIRSLSRRLGNKRTRFELKEVPKTLFLPLFLNVLFTKIPKGKCLYFTMSGSRFSTASMSCPAGYTFDTTPRVAPYAAATESYEPGQRIKSWDHEIIWTKHHLPASKLEPLRALGDPLADDAQAALEIKPGEDALEALLAYTAQPLDEQKSTAPQRLLTQVMTVPEWVDWDRLQRGQQVYWRYYPFMQSALLHFVAAVGTSLPKPMKVVKSTGYLFGQHTKQRFVETAQFVHEVNYSPQYLKPGSGLAWKSMVRVRFLHAGVRVRLLKISRNHPKYYNIEHYGIPINQEDLLSVLFSLSALMWQAMELRLDVHMTTEEREDYMHLWRYVGYMMGVDDTLDVTRTHGRADACLESMMLHLGAPDADSGQLLSTMARNLYPPSRRVLGILDRYKLHMALAEQLIGSEGWKIQGLPSMTWPYEVVRELILYIMLLDLWLVRQSSWWFRFRNSVLRELASRSISKRLGNKRTRFELREVPKVRDNEPVSESNDGEDGISSGQLWPMVSAIISIAVGVALVLSQCGLIVSDLGE